MRKLVTRVVLTLLLLVAVPLAGACTQPASELTPGPSPTLTPTPEPELPKQFVIVYSGSGKLGSISAYISEMLTKYTSMTGSVEKTAGPTASIQMVAAGEADATSYSGPSVRPSCIQEKIPLRLLFCGAGVSTSTTIGIYTKPGAGINSIADLKGKKVYAEKPSIVWMAPVMDALLAVNSMNRDDFDYLIFASGTEAIRDLKEGRVDAVFYVAGRDTTEMGESIGLFVIPFTPAEQKAVVDLGLGWESFNWPAGFFGNKVDTPVVAAPPPFYTGVDTDEYTAYTVVKTVYDHLTEFQNSQKAAQGYTLETATAVWPFPYHPGAIKYFKEIGIWSAEHDAKQTAALAEWERIIGK
ncbi:hypothetical protein ES705_12003 [subsurface metagenome]